MVPGERASVFSPGAPRYSRALSLLRKFCVETVQHQEWRARQHISIAAILKAGLGTGLLFFVVSGGSPWSTAGTMNAIMGRDIPLSFPMLALGHLALSLVYMVVIASAIYRLRTPVAVFVGLAVTMVLYGLNFAIFHLLGGTMQSPEFRVFLVHFMFGLFASLLYKALSVPRPLPR